MLQRSLRKITKVIFFTQKPNWNHFYLGVLSQSSGVFFLRTWALRLSVDIMYLTSSGYLTSRVNMGEDFCRSLSCLKVLLLEVADVGFLVQSSRRAFVKTVWWYLYHFHLLSNLCKFKELPDTKFTEGTFLIWPCLILHFDNWCFLKSIFILIVKLSLKYK